MTRHFMITASAFGLLLGLSAPVSATKSSPPGVVTHSGANMDSLDSIVANFPAPAPGMQQFVIMLPPMADEYAHRVGLLVGKMEETDGVNTVSIAGKLMEKHLQGWGYNYFEVEGAGGPSMTTLIGVMPGTPRVTKFLSLPESLVRYNSRLPIVVYAPENFEVRYRVFAAGQEQSALAGPKGNPVTNSPGKVQGFMPPGGVIQGGPTGGVVSAGPSSGVVIGGPGGTVTNGRTTGGPGFIPRRVIPGGSGNTYKDRTINSPVYGGPTRVSPPASGLASNEIKLLAVKQYKIPSGSSATVRLYDAMRNGPENSFASSTTPIDDFSAALTMPDFKITKDLVMPAVDVSIYGPDGQLIYVNNQATMINYHGPTPLRMVRPGEDYDYDQDNAQDEY